MPRTNEEVQRRDLVKGYEFQKGRYLLLTDEDIDSLKVEGSSAMNIEKFVEVDSIDPIYYASSYYLAPDGDAGILHPTETPGAMCMLCCARRLQRLGRLPWRVSSSASATAPLH